MTSIPINDPANHSSMPILNSGFRPFFLAAGLFSALSVCLWLGVYLFAFELTLAPITPSQWHGHEMVFGYCMAVIAGFVLTAASNWTGLTILHKWPLAVVVTLWAIARLCLALGLVVEAAIADLLMGCLFIIAVSVPIIRTQRWRQMAVISKLILIVGCNLLFYLGAMGLVDQGTFYGLYGGLFAVIGLVLMMGRRVIPFFIDKATPPIAVPKNSKFLDLASLVLFLVFFVAELSQQPLVASYSALLLGLVNLIRLVNWHVPGLWQRPLLWSLYLGMWHLALGFILIYAAYAYGISKSLAIHSLAYGGIGMITLGMMARVALGHTGRSIHEPPKGLAWALAALHIGAVIRVYFCALMPAYYTTWVAIAMGLWVLAFLVFFYQYLPMLSKARIDGRYG